MLAAVIALVFIALLCTGLYTFAAALRRTWLEPEAAVRSGLRLIMALACCMFLLPFAVIIGRWAQTGGLDILSVEIILVAGPLAAGLACALAASRRET